jgi:hypothetical protein
LKGFDMTKESPRFKEIVEEAMHEFKSGKLKSGSNGKIVKDRKQAIAIALSEARQNGE